MFHLLHGRRVLGRLHHAAHTGQLVEQARHATHVTHLLKLVLEVLEVHGLAFLELLGNFLGLGLVQLALGFFHQGQHVAHAENPAGDTVRVERLQGIGLLAHTDKLDRLAGKVANRESGTTAGITIRLGQNHTGERQGFIEGLGRIGGILTGHGIDHEQGFHRADGPVQALYLTHHVFIDMESTGGIDDQHIHVATTGFFQGAVGDIHRVLIAGGGEEVGLHLPRQGFQLLDRRRAIHVGGHHHDLLLLPFLQEAGEFGHGSGLTGTLQAGHQDNGRRLGGQVKGVIGVAHGVDQLVIDDLHKRLAGIQALQDFLAQGLFFHLFDKLFHYWQSHIGLQQCLAYFAQGVADIVFGQ